MSDYQAQFDAHIKAATDAFTGHAAEVLTIIPGLYSSNFRRLLSSISRLLGFIDRRQAAHPEYLADTPRNVPERAVETAAGVPSSLESGAAHFVQNLLPTLTQIERRLVEAVGGAAFTADQIRTQQVKAIEKTRVAVANIHKQVSEEMTAIGHWKKDAGDAHAVIKQAGVDSATDRKIVSDIRTLAEKLARGNASQNPLEKLVQAARARLEEVQKVKETVDAAAAGANVSANSAKEFEKEAEITLGLLEATDVKADAILRNATQAGLAGAFKTERDTLKKEQRNFAYTFYGIIAAIIIYALAFLLPIVRDALDLEGEAAARESAIMLFVRVVILAPVVWALVFTNRRFRYLETLQMDYAAKANTALAFSGYIDEMRNDPELQHELKRGLVRRFVEHPSRLLENKTSNREEASSVPSSPRASNDDDEGKGLEAAE
jgi:hypothetical protein